MLPWKLVESWFLKTSSLSLKSQQSQQSNLFSQGPARNRGAFALLFGFHYLLT
jgi:hypothetical protein